MTAERAARYRLGLRAETLAAALLRLKGFRILARRYRSPGGEVDIVARRGRVVAFVEVKARDSAAAGLEAVSAQQRRRIRRGAEAFLATHPQLAGHDLRFDLVVVAPRRWPLHITAAFGDDG